MNSRVLARRSALAVLAVFLVLSAHAGRGRADDPRTSRAARFGYGTLRAAGKAAVGRRPVLVVLVDYRDVRFQAAHTPAYYDTLLFGNVAVREHPSLNAYFSQASGGKFTFTKAGMVGPIRSFPMGSEAADESDFNCALNMTIDATERVVGREIPVRRRLCSRQDASWTWEQHMDRMIQEVSRRRLFDFAPYDRNHDGVVTHDELTIIFVGANPRMVSGRSVDPVRFPWTCDNCGAARDRTFPLMGTSLRYSGKITSVGEGVGFSTLAHELSHSLGTFDVYGAGSRLNGGATLMAGTMGPPNEPHPTYLDPYHRMRLGWTEPRVHSVREEGMAVLVAPQLGGADTRPVLLYSESKGVQEYFLVEYRHKELGAFDRYWWDGGRDKGVLVWHVRTDANHDLFAFPAPGRASNEQDMSLVYRGVTDSSTWAYGTGRGFFREDGTITLKWNDNSDTGIRLRVGPMHDRQPHVVVDWGFRHEFPPTITSPSLTTRIGQPFSLEGRFGVRQDQTIQLLDPRGRRIPLPIESWSLSRIVSRIPDTVAAGSYRLIAFSDLSLSAHDLGITATIQGGSLPRPPGPIVPAPIPRPRPLPRLPRR